MENVKDSNSVSETVTIDINVDEDQRLAPSSSFTRFRDSSPIWAYVYYGAIMVMYAPLIELLQVKFQNKKQSPFETHGFFMIMPVAALFMVLLVLGILIYHNHHSEGSNSKFFSAPTSRIILINVLWFSMILAPLSLVLVLVIPPKFIWIGYSIVCVLFLAIVAYNFADHMRSLAKTVTGKLTSSM